MADKSFKVVVTQGGYAPRTIYTKSNGTINAIMNVLEDMMTGEAPVQIFASPIVTEES